MCGSCGAERMIPHQSVITSSITAEFPFGVEAFLVRHVCVEGSREELGSVSVLYTLRVLSIGQVHTVRVQTKWGGGGGALRFSLLI